MQSPRTARGNRLGLAFLGLLSLAGGSFALAQSQNVLVAGSANRPLLTPSETSFARTNGWFWIAVAAAAVVVALGCVRWLLVQARRAKLNNLRVEPDPITGATHIGADLLADAVSTEISSYADVTRSHAQFTGYASRPELRLNVRAAERADLPGLRHRIAREAVAHARVALDLDELPVYLNLTLDMGTRQT
jgi:hypothetical protein